MAGNNNLKNKTMKKSVIKISFVILTLLLAVSCEDNRLNDMADEKVYLIYPVDETDPDFLEIDIFDFGTYPYHLGVYKSGYGLKSGKVTISVDQETLNDYNLENGTVYEILHSVYYQLPEANSVIPAESSRIYMPVEFNTTEMAKLTDLYKYVLPIKLTADGIDVSAEKQSVLISPNLQTPYIMFDDSDLSAEVTLGPASADEISYMAGILTNYPNQWDLTYGIVADASLVEQYNTDNGTGFTFLPSNAYELFPNEWTLPSKTSSKLISYKILKKNLKDENGKYLFDNYLLPLRISEVSKWEIHPVANTSFVKVIFNPSKLLKHNWMVIDWNSSIHEDAIYENSPSTPDKIIDMDETPGGVNYKWWSSKWVAPLNPLPYHITIDMASPKTIVKLQLTFPTNSDDSWRGNIKSGYFETSDDGSTWTKLIDFERPNDADRENNFDTPETTARYLKIVMEKPFSYFEGGQGARMNILELNVFGFD